MRAEGSSLTKMIREGRVSRNDLDFSVLEWLGDQEDIGEDN